MAALGSQVKQDLQRPPGPPSWRLVWNDLTCIIKSKTTVIPARRCYIIACSLYAIIGIFVGLPAKLSLAAADGTKEDFTIADADAKYLQELAWKIYRQRDRIPNRQNNSPTARM